MPNEAKITIRGHLATEAELKFSQNGKAYMNFNVAVGQKYNKETKQCESTEFYRVSCFGYSAEWLAGLSAQKGDAVIASGRLETEMYNDQKQLKIMADFVGLEKRKGEAQQKKVDVNSIDEVSDSEVPF